MSLSRRDSAKVNAGLLEVHHAGIDTAEVTEIARAMMNNGTPPRQAYEAAFDKFATHRPEFRAPLMRIGQLIDATDLPTLARYNVAMSRYIETGDYAEIEAVAPIVQQDLTTMAAETGDAGFAEMAGTVAVAEPQSAPTSNAAQEARPGHTPIGFQPSTVPNPDSQE
ncbi:hypothetical protein [Alteriqipengyuania sp.]|uniref:hypothetical protein n=1 Tax=Alteriqipengyuania sp. TaxID=2800692 RepID=UPI003512A138